MFKFGETVEITGINFFEGVKGRLVDKRNNNGGEYLVRFIDIPAPDKWFQASKLRHINLACVGCEEITTIQSETICKDRQ